MVIFTLKKISVTAWVHYDNYQYVRGGELGVCVCPNGPNYGTLKFYNIGQSIDVFSFTEA